MPKITLNDVKAFFGYANLSDFSADWKLLSVEDREQIRGGIENATLTY